MGLSKVMTVTCTYDHRVIQGAESGLFLAQHAGAARRRRRVLRQDFRRSRHSVQARALGSRSTPPRRSVNADPAEASRASRSLIQAWRERGHLAADIDPLGIPRPPASGSRSLRARADHLGSGPHVSTPVPSASLTLRDLLDRLRLTYAGKMGVEFMHMRRSGGAPLVPRAAGADGQPVDSRCRAKRARP